MNTESLRGNQGKGFDFEAGLDKFSEIEIADDDVEKLRQIVRIALLIRRPTVDSFFDTISCEATERAANGGRRQRPDRQAQRQQNIEAFGVEGLQRERRYRGNRNRGYRGNRNSRGNRNNNYRGNRGNDNRKWRQRNNNNNNNQKRSNNRGGQGNANQWATPGAQNAASAGQ